MNRYFTPALIIYALVFTTIFDCNIFAQSENKLFGKEYYPVDTNTRLIYNSNFGEAESSYKKLGNEYKLETKADKFYYTQNLLVKDDGIFLTEVYQKVNALLFLTSERRSRYNEPAIKVPLPLQVGQKWEWNGYEFYDDNKEAILIKGTVVGEEMVKTEMGEFNCVKVIQEVIKENEIRSSTIEWRYPEIGLVKFEVIFGKGGFIGKLAKLLGYSQLNFELIRIEKI